MDVTVRVISGGQEVEKIICPVLMENGSPAVVYQQRLWPVINGCIHIGDECQAGDQWEPEWPLLVNNLLPPALPKQVGACIELLQVCFRESLPHGVIQAVATLVALNFEQQARALLVDVLKEHRDAARLHRLLRMQLLFRERSGRTKESFDFEVSPETEESAEPEPPQDEGQGWEWAASPEELAAPDVDDSALRSAAADLQVSIGAYRAKETGARILEFEELGDSAFLQVAQSRTNDHHHDESLILERVAKLGATALDLLRYFADNPGDKALHAENVLGYPISEINRLLRGSLSHYLKQSDLGGWECQPWVVAILSVLDETHDGG